METLDKVIRQLNRLHSNLKSDMESFRSIIIAKEEYANRLHSLLRQNKRSGNGFPTDTIGNSVFSTAKEFLKEEKRRGDVLISLLRTSTLPALTRLEDGFREKISAFQGNIKEFFNRDKELNKMCKKAGNKKTVAVEKHLKEAFKAERIRNYLKYEKKIDESLAEVDVVIKKTTEGMKEEVRRVGQFLGNEGMHIDVLNEIEFEGRESFRQQIREEIGKCECLEGRVRFRGWGGWKEGILRVFGEDFVITGDGWRIGKGEQRGEGMRIKERGWWGFLQYFGFGVLEVEFFEEKEFSAFKKLVVS